MRKIIASLDVGSCSVKLIVGEIYKQKLNILTCIDTPSRGIKNGYVVNSESANESFKETFKKAKEMLGIDVKKVVVTIPSYGAQCFYTEGSTSVSSSEKIIMHKDIIRCMQAAVYNKVKDNQELVSLLPTGFVINDIDKVANPLKMQAEKLTIKSVGVVVPKNNISTIVKALEKLRVEVIDTIVCPLGDYFQNKTEETQNKVGAVVNIGANKTEVSIFNKGILTAIETIEVGGRNIDADFAYIYKLNRKDSMYLKENVSLAHLSLAQTSESITLTNKMREIIKINQYNASEITSERLAEILNLIKKQINLLTKKEISYIMVTGGITEIKDFNILAEEIFGKKVIYSNVNEIGIRHNKYSSAAGLIKYYHQRLKLRGIEFSIFSEAEEEDFSGIHRKINVSDNSILGKLFGYFFDS